MPSPVRSIVRASKAGAFQPAFAGQWEGPLSKVRSLSEVAMPSGAVLAIVIGCLVIALAAGAAAMLEMRVMTTRRQFGSEYEQLASRLGHRRARAELIARKRRVAKLRIQPLPADRRTHYSAEWTSAQELFVDDPPKALSTAAELVLSVAKERGYPADDRKLLLEDLSVAHARRLASYRRAEETAANAASATTEDLRQALLWYRAMFRDLADAGKQGGPAAPLRRLAPALPRPALPRPALPRPTFRRPALPRPSLRQSLRQSPRRTPKAPAAQLPMPALPRPSLRLRRPSLRLRRPSLRLRRAVRQLSPATRPRRTLPRLPRLPRPGSGDTPKR
jgi:hypothetical protein